MKHIVYIIQCSDHVNSNIYKIGYSLNGIQRLYSYSINARILCTLYHPDPVECEKNLIVHFRNKYILHKGKEYFKINADRNAIIDEFIDVVRNNRKIEDVDENTNAQIEGNAKNNEKYHCVCCDYFTVSSGNIYKHKRTQKHLTELSKSDLDEKYIIQKIRVFSCKHCNKNFKRNSSKWKHEKICEPCNNNNSNEIETFNKMVNDQNKQLQKYELIVDKIIDSKK